MQIEFQDPEEPSAFNEGDFNDVIEGKSIFCRSSNNQEENYCQKIVDEVFAQYLWSRVTDDLADGGSEKASLKCILTKSDYLIFVFFLIYLCFSTFVLLVVASFFATDRNKKVRLDNLLKKTNEPSIPLFVQE